MPAVVSSPANASWLEKNGTVGTCQSTLEKACQGKINRTGGIRDNSM